MKTRVSRRDDPLAEGGSAGSAAWLILQPLLINLIGIPAFVYIIRVLGPLAYGQWAVGMSLVALTGSLTNLGLRAPFVRLVAQEPEKGAEGLAEQLGLRALLACVAGCLAVLLCACLDYPRIVLTCVAISAVGLLLSSLGSATADVLQGSRRLKTYALVNLIAGVVLTAASVLVTWQGGGPAALAASYLTGPAVSLGLSLIVIQKQGFRVRIRWECARYRELLWETRTLSTSQMLAAIRYQIEPLLVPKLVGIASFGYFSAGSLPASRLSSIPDGLMTVFYPVIARRYRESPEEADQQVLLAMKSSLLLCLPLAVMITILAQPIAELLFPRQPALCREVIAVTIWSVVLQAIYLPMIYAMQAAGKFSEVGRTGIWVTICSVALAILLIRSWGVLGACWSWVAHSAVWVGLLAPGFLRHFPTVVPRLPLARIVACALVLTVTVWLSGALHVSPLLKIGLGGALGALSYLGALLTLRLLPASALKGRTRGASGPPAVERRPSRVAFLVDQRRHRR